MNTLKSRIDSLASAFASDVVRAIRSASLEELLGGVGAGGSVSPLRRGPGRPPRAAAAAAVVTAPRPRAGKGGRLARRSPEEIKNTLDKVHGLLRASKGGLRAEQIRAALKLDVREMPRVLKEGLATKKLASKGQKRATTYFAK
jgi:hypothetical protein